jgi:hypothetical protein
MDDLDLRVRLQDDQLIRKFNQVQSYMVDDMPDSKIDKTGNAAAMRLAINLAHKRMEELQHEEKNITDNYQQLKRELDKMAENL